MLPWTSIVSIIMTAYCTAKSPLLQGNKALALKGHLIIYVDKIGNHLPVDNPGVFAVETNAKVYVNLRLVAWDVK